MDKMGHFAVYAFSLSGPQSESPSFTTWTASFLNAEPGKKKNKECPSKGPGLWATAGQSLPPSHTSFGPGNRDLPGTFPGSKEAQLFSKQAVYSLWNKCVLSPLELTDFTCLGLLIKYILINIFKNHIIYTAGLALFWTIGNNYLFEIGPSQARKPMTINRENGKVTGYCSGL